MQVVQKSKTQLSKSRLAFWSPPTTQRFEPNVLQDRAWYFLLIFHYELEVFVATWTISKYQVVDFRSFCCCLNHFKRQVVDFKFFAVTQTTLSEVSGEDKAMATTLWHLNIVELGWHNYTLRIQR